MCVAILLALPPTVVRAVGFAPGSDADPPTGQAVVPDDQASAAAEPLRTPGIRWDVRGVRLGGHVTLEGRWLRDAFGGSTTQSLVHSEVEWRGFVWQPWFAQMRLGLGVLASQDRGDAAFGTGATRGVGLTGHASVSLFPASRFPFEMRAVVGDSRTSSEYFGNDVQTRRFSVSQTYQPARGSERYQVQIDHSRFEGREGSDVLTNIFATATQRVGAHSLEVSGSQADNRNEFEHSTNRSIFGRYGFMPSNQLSIDTVASWNVFEYAGRSVQLLDSRTDLRQISSIGVWRPAPGEPLYVETMPMNIVGAARWIDAGFGIGDNGDSRVQAVSATLGANVELSPSWRVGVSGSVGRTRNTGIDSDAASGNGTLSWTPEGAMLGEWRYAPQASLSLGLSDDNLLGRAWQAGVVAGHGISRYVNLGESRSLAFNLSQSLGTLRDSRRAMDARAISHSVGLSWQASDEAGGQSFASLSLTDSRTRADIEGNYQFASLQLNRRSFVSRTTSWSASASVQAARNQSTEVDAFTGATFNRSPGWNLYYTGGGGLEQHRIFGVPGLRHSLNLMFSSQQIERRQFGDVDASREHVTASLESRLDYTVGRLGLRASLRSARVGDRRVDLILLRVQRHF